MDTLHEVTDPAKAERIAESIELNGWQGAPMVSDGDLLITGVHRYAAMRMLDRNMEVDQHTIDIRELVENYDEQIAELMADDFTGVEALQIVLEDMPEATREEYGIDLH